MYRADPRRRDNAIYPAPGRRGANERNRRGFASHTATQEQEYPPRPRSAVFDPRTAGENAVGKSTNESDLQVSVAKMSHSPGIVMNYGLFGIQ